jgi:hypothetical protein
MEITTTTISFVTFDEGNEIRHKNVNRKNKTKTSGKEMGLSLPQVDEFTQPYSHWIHGIIEGNEWNARNGRVQED